MTTTTAPTESALELARVSKWIRVGFWGRRRDLLHEVSLRVPAGSVFGFVGPNGAGKSTIIKHVIGGARPTTGTITVFGRSPREALARRRLGYMPEVPQLPPTLTPLELITLHGVLVGLSSSARQKRCDELLDLVGLRDRARDRVGTFSKGMQQRVALSLALLGSPDLLVLDEPMSGLDPLGRRLVRDIIRNEGKKGRTVFFSSHVLSDVEALCDEVAFLNRGRLLSAGPVDDAIGNRSLGYELRISAPTGQRALPEGIAALGDVHPSGASFVVVIPPQRDPIEAAMRIRDAGCRIETIEPMRVSLEDRLVELLGDDARRAS